MGNIEKHYSHFACRLKERYGIKINPEEYLELCNADFKEFDDGRQMSKSRKVIILIVKKVPVIAVKHTSSRKKYLVTALPIGKQKYFIEQILNHNLKK